MSMCKKTKLREEEVYNISFNDTNNAQKREITRRYIKNQDQDAWVEKLLPCYYVISLQRS
jgi:hypothetical protein